MRKLISLMVISLMFFACSTPEAQTETKLQVKSSKSFLQEKTKTAEPKTTEARTIQRSQQTGYEIELTDPHLGNACGQHFKWQNKVVKNWRDCKDYGTCSTPEDEKFRLYGELVQGNPQNLSLWICPIQEEPMRCWNQTTISFKDNKFEMELCLKRGNHSWTKFEFRNGYEVLCDIIIE